MSLNAVGHDRTMREEWTRTRGGLVKVPIQEEMTIVAVANITSMNVTVTGQPIRTVTGGGVMM